MREIKFRAWNSLDNTMIEWETIKFFSELLSGLITGKIKHHYLMQYTGRKNKNGFEIYEGDILRLDADVFAVVEYSEQDAAFMFSNGDMIADYHINEMEIVGNIYENPELLEYTQC